MTKRVRLPGGKWITRVLPESNPQDLAAASADEIWECGDGRKILVRDMDTRHIANAMRFCRLKSANTLTAAGEKITGWDESRMESFTYNTSPIYRMLRAEFNKRLAQTIVTTPVPIPKQLDLEPKVEEPPVRQFSFD